MSALPYCGALLTLRSVWKKLMGECVSRARPILFFAPIFGLLNGRTGIKFDIIIIRLFSKNSMWLSPLDSNNKVLIKGIANASKGVIPVG